MLRSMDAFVCFLCNLLGGIHSLKFYSAFVSACPPHHRHFHFGHNFCSVMHATIMRTLLEALLASVVCLIAWILYCVAIVARRRIVIKRQFPGPPTTSFLLGNPPPPPSSADLQKSPLYTAALAGWRDEQVLEHHVACASVTGAVLCLYAGNLAETNVADRHKVITQCSYMLCRELVTVLTMLSGCCAVACTGRSSTETIGHLCNCSRL